MVDENQTISAHWLRPSSADEETYMSEALIQANATISSQAFDDRNFPVFLLSELISLVMGAETLDEAEQAAAATLVRYLAYRIERPL